jgi:heme/copper-type cytochrome/quinol oxidase subunit 1
MNQTMMINVVTFAVIGGVVYLALRLKKQLPKIGESIKNNVFTIHGVVIALLYNIFGLGVICAYICYQLNAGEAVNLTYPNVDTAKTIIKGDKGK